MKEFIKRMFEVAYKNIWALTHAHTTWEKFMLHEAKLHIEVLEELMRDGLIIEGDEMFNRYIEDIEGFLKESGKLWRKAY